MRNMVQLHETWKSVFFSNELTIVNNIVVTDSRLDLAYNLHQLMNIRIDLPTNKWRSASPLA